VEELTTRGKTNYQYRNFLPSFLRKTKQVSASESKTNLIDTDISIFGVVDPKEKLKGRHK